MNRILYILRLLSPWVSQARYYSELARQGDVWRESERLLKEQIDRLHPKIASNIGVCVYSPRDFDGRKLTLKVQFEIDRIESDTSRRQVIDMILKNARQELEKFLAADEIDIETNAPE